MKTVRFIIATFIALLSSCAAPPPSMPGMATLRVTIVAEPKTGAVTGNTHVLSYDSAKSSSNSGGAFEHVDYASLDDVVIWIDPAAGGSDSKPVQVEVTGQAAQSLAAAVGPGEFVTLHNNGSSSISLYSVSDGNDFDLGTLNAGGSTQFKSQAPGLVEVLSEGMKDPVALIFVAPSSSVQLAHAGQTLDFPNLSPGKCVIHSWHPRLPGRSVSVLLQADHVTEASIKVGVNDLPKIDTP